GTALATGRPAAPGAAAHAEQILEDIREGRAEIGTEAGAATHAAETTLLEGGMAEPVIGGSLVGVLENLVGLVAFLEPDLAILVAGIAIRMVLHRRLAERGLQLTLRAGPADAENFVIVAFGHQLLSPDKERPHPAQ